MPVPYTFTQLGGADNPATGAMLDADFAYLVDQIATTDAVAQILFDEDVIADPSPRALANLIITIMAEIAALQQGPIFAPAMDFSIENNSGYAAAIAA